MPESKLAEKLGFRIHEIPHLHAGARYFKYYNSGLSAPASDAEVKLWNLCLELSAKVEELQERIDSMNDDAREAAEYE